MSEEININKYPGRLKVEWKLNKFYDKCRENDYSLNSPVFSLCCTKWSLMIHLQHQSILPLAGWINLYLRHEESEKRHHICWKIGLKIPVGKSDAREIKSFSFTNATQSEENTWGVTRFIQTVEQNNLSHIPVLNVSNATKLCSFATESMNRCGARLNVFRVSDICHSDGSLAVFCNADLSDRQEVSFSDGLMTMSENFLDLYRSKRFTDVTIKVKDKEFLVHKFVLVARSKVFAAMFDNDMAEKNSGRVEVTDCDPDAFEDLLLFLYTGRFDILSSDFTNLYEAADKYEMEDLKEECVRGMISNLSSDSFCEVLQVATMHSQSDLLTAARNFFFNNVKTILPTEKFQSILEEQPALVNQLLLKFIDK